MLKFFKKNLALPIMLCAISSACALEVTFKFDRMPDEYSSEFVKNSYLKPKFIQGKVEISTSSDVFYYSNTQDIFFPSTGSEYLSIRHLPFISYYKITYNYEKADELLEDKLDPFELKLTNYRKQYDYITTRIKAITLTYGVKFVWNNFRYSLLTDETAQVERSANASEIVVPSILEFENEGWYNVTVTTVYENTFANLSKLQKVSLPSTIESIGSGAFSNSPNLSTVIVQSVTPPTLSEDAFDKDASQKIAVYVPAKSYSAYKSAPVWKDLNIIPSSEALTVDGMEYIPGDDTVVLTAFGNDVESASVPSAISLEGKEYPVVVGILPGNSYPNLKSIYIDENVGIQSLSGNNFPNLKKLTYLGTSAPTVNPGAMTSPDGQDIQIYGVNEEAIATIVAQTKGTPRIYPLIKNRFTADGIVYFPTSTAGRTCDAVDYDYVTASLVIGETATYRNVKFTIQNINPYLFHQAKSIETITVNNDLPLPSYFAKETSVLEINLKCTDIPTETFINSANLERLTINTTGNIGVSAFANSSTALTNLGAEIEINNEGKIERNAFNSFGPIDLLHIGKKVTGIEASAFEGAFSVDAKGAVDIECNGSIGEKAFYNTNNIKDLYIAESVTGIGAEAFRNAMTADQQVTVFLDNSGEIAEDAFRNNSALAKVQIGDCCTSIAETAFTENEALTDVTVGNGCVSIANQAFANNPTLEKVVLGDAVKTIGNELFINNTALKDVTFGSALTALGDYVFDNCAAMEKITVNAVEPPVCGTYDFRHIDTWSCELLVPRKSIDAYANAPQWNEFMNLSALVDPNEVTDIIVDPDSDLGFLFDSGLELYVNDSKEITVKILPVTADAELSWSSSDESVAVVVNGTVTAVGSGEAVISVKAGDISREFTVKVNKREQAILWEQEFAGLSEGATVELSATATSGLDVDYTVISGAASVDGATLKIENSGAVIIEASQPGNDEYLPAEAVRKNFNAMSGVDVIDANGTLFSVEGNELVILSGHYSLYDLRGILLLYGEAPARITLQSGNIFILRINNKNIKLIID